jgi:hypothetical protein
MREIQVQGTRADHVGTALLRRRRRLYTDDRLSESRMICIWELKSGASSGLEYSHPGAEEASGDNTGGSGSCGCYGGGGAKVSGRCGIGIQAAADVLARRPYLWLYSFMFCSSL